MAPLDLNCVADAVELIKKGVIDNPSIVVGFTYKNNLFGQFDLEMFVKMRGHSFTFRITKQTQRTINPQELADAFLHAYRTAVGKKGYLGKLL